MIVVAHKGLEILHELLLNVGRAPNVAQGFYHKYLCAMMNDVFAVMSDRSHKSSFEMHVSLLHHMFFVYQDIVGQPCSKRYLFAKISIKRENIYNAPIARSLSPLHL
mmetsp:Transcript_10947/g.16121  ORF Transcript_10947/g.16121 Transcript_10947/m.16121 type:complete len:107 (-) Transcript_10947:635-955(-)